VPGILVSMRNAKSMRGAIFCALIIGAGAAAAETEDSAGAMSPRESLDEAWWTGPLLAANASTLPPGHFLVEPYIYDSLPYAHFDSRGVARDVAHANDFGSQSYVNYGLAEGFTVGLIPRFGYDQPRNGEGSSGIGVGDLSVQAQYRLTQFQEGHWLPTISVNLMETLPTGEYDRLDRPSDGFGAGAYTTTLSLYSQSYFWLSNGRILRARFNLSYATSGRVNIEDASVYGTTAGFHGHANPGDTTVADLAFEYSATRHWVLALDLWYERDGATSVFGSGPSNGNEPPPALQSSSGVGRVLFVAPAVEYNWNSRVGVIFGFRLAAAGWNETATLTPVMAINCVI
jgi:hypothetical protein